MSLRWQWALILVVTGLLAVAGAQSLGDVARQQRQLSDKPKAKRVVTNEELGSTAPVGPSSDQADAAAAPASVPQTYNAGGDAQSAQRELLRARVSDARNKVQQLETEVRELENQQILRDRAAFYGDASVAGQDPMKRAEEQKRFAADLNKKRQELSEARTELEDMSARARQADAVAAPASRPQTRNAGDDPTSAQRELWRARVIDAKNKIVRLEAEVRDLENQQILRDRAAFYGDASMAAQDPMKRAEEQKRFAADLNKKRQELNEARADLEDTLARARGAGFR